MVKVAIVGVCASGKTTLVRGLREAGIDAYNVAQEHSCIHRFWQKHAPDLLIMIKQIMARFMVVPYADQITLRALFMARCWEIQPEGKFITTELI